MNGRLTVRPDTDNNPGNRVDPLGPRGREGDVNKPPTSIRRFRGQVQYRSGLARVLGSGCDHLPRGPGNMTFVCEFNNYADTNPR